MEEDSFSLNHIIKICIFSLFVVGIVLLSYQIKHHTIVVFCDVGQGDGAYIRTATDVDIVIDAGGGARMLSCLGTHMPFYDRTIELAFITHPQKDHYGGFTSILDRYHIAHLLLPRIQGTSKSFRELEEKLLAKKTSVKFAYQGEVIDIGKEALVKLLWPTQSYITHQTNPNLQSDDVLGAFSTSRDPNEFSLIFVYREKNFEILFTGDATGAVLTSLTKNDLDFINGLDILKTPHHGSKNGLTQDFLELADPVLSVISVGKRNSYGHPSREVIDMFQSLKKEYLTTADSGDIVVMTDGKSFEVK